MYRIDLPERVGKSSKRSSRTKTPRTSLSIPPSSTPRSSQKRGPARKDKKRKKTSKVENTDDFYEIKRIVDQEDRGGEIWYLVDWEDHKITGEAYPHEWVHHSGVTLPAVAEWQNNSSKDSSAPLENSSPLPNEPESPEDSQPIAPRKRKRRLVSGAEVAAKRVRHVSPQSSGSGEAQAISQSANVHEQAEDREPEIPDSYEEEREGLQRAHIRSQEAKAKVPGGRQARVEVRAPKDFDASAYTTHNLSSSSQVYEPREEFSSDLVQSQDSQISQQRRFASGSGRTQSSSAPQARQLSPANIWDGELEERDFENEANQVESFGKSRTPESRSGPAPSSSVPVIPRSSQAPFIWDSDIEGEEFEDEEIDEPLEIPDSQELRGSSSYNPSETPTSRTVSSSDTTTKHNTQANTEASLEAIESRNSQWYSSSSKQQESGSIESQFAQRASDFDHEGYTLTPEPPSAQVPITQTKTSHGSEVNLDHSQPPASASQPVTRSSDDFVERSSPPAVSQSHRSQPSRARSTEEELSVGFQTQLPRISCEEDSSAELPPSSDNPSDPNLEEHLDFDLSSEDSQLAEEKERSDRQSPERQSGSKSLSSFADSQGQSRTQNPQRINTVSSQLRSSCARGTSEDPIQIASPDDESFPNITASQTANTQKSSSSKSSGHSQASSHLPSPPVEELRLSIEEVESLDVEYPPTVYQSSSMEPVNDPAMIASNEAVKTQAPDPTAMLKARMAEARAARAAAALSKSPALTLVQSNQSAVTQNQTVPIQPPVDISPRIPPAVAPFESPAASAADTSIAAASVLGATTLAEEVAISTPAVTEPITYPEEYEDEEPTSLSVLSLGPAEYEVPLPMTSYTRDVYIRRIKIYRVQLQSFLQDEVLDEALVAEVKSLLYTLQTICSHPGLLDEDPSQNEDHEIQAKWAENISTKFIFLAEFLELMTATDNHVVIVARPGQLLNELESLLIYHAIEYSRADRERRTSTRSFRVTLCPTGAQQYTADPASIVIAFDPSYRQSPFINQLRVHPSLPDILVPLVSLVVTNSVEHIERCFDTNIEAPGRLIKIASCMRQLMGRVGTFDEEGYDDPPSAASKIANYLSSDPRKSSWPLLPMPDIHGLDLSLLSSQNFLEEQITYNATSTANLQSGVKRPLELEESIADKRQRLTPSNGSSNSELESPHISETVLHTSTTPLDSRPVQSLAGEELTQLSSLLQKVSNIEAQLRVKDATEMELREINQDLEARCKSFEDSIASIQPKYQEALNDRGEFEHQNSLSMAREIRLKKERDNKDAEVIKLRERNAELEAELSAAQTALRTSAVPEAAEFATLRDELAKSRLETEREHKRYVNANNDLDYIRSTFQASSSSAAEHQAEVFRLQTELDAFREKAAHDKVRIHEIQSTNENAQLRRENTELRARLKDMERDYEKKQQEYLAVTNGRRGTRGTSVPQSPRMGNQIQNSPGTRPIGRVLHGGSRGNSPAPGEMRIASGPGPIAGGHFGDALFPNSLPPPPPRDRWGQHLQ